MAGCSPNLFSQSDGHHLHQSTFVNPAEIGMWFYAVDDNNPVSLGSVSVNEDRQSIAVDSNLNDLHGGVDRGPYAFFCNPQIFSA